MSVKPAHAATGKRPRAGNQITESRVPFWRKYHLLRSTNKVIGIQYAARAGLLSRLKPDMMMRCSGVYGQPLR